MKKLNIDYDIFADIQTPLKNSQSDIHKDYPIVAEALKRFKET